MLFNEGLEQQQSTLNSVDFFGLDHCHDQVPNQASGRTLSFCLNMECKKAPEPAHTTLNTIPPPSADPKAAQTESREQPPDDMEPRQTAWKTPAKRSSTVSSRQPIEMIRTKAQKKWPSGQVIGQVVVSGRNLEHICGRIESRRQRSSCRRPHAAVIVRYAIISMTAMYFLDKFISEESHIISSKKTPAFSWCFLKIKLQGILLLIIMPARA